MANVAITCPKKVTFPKKQPFYLFALLVTPCPLEGFVTLMSTGNSGALAEMTNAVFLLLRGQSSSQENQTHRKLPQIMKLIMPRFLKQKQVVGVLNS